jgi:hypothetical protein
MLRDNNFFTGGASSSQGSILVASIKRSDIIKDILTDMQTFRGLLLESVYAVNLIYAHMVQVYDIAYENIYGTVMSLAMASTFLLLLCAAKDETSCRYHGQNVLLYFLAEKSILTNLASEAMDARCGDCV